MFDITKPAISLLDTDRLVKLLENNNDSGDRAFIIDNWVATQNSNSKCIVTPLGTDTNANTLAMETFPAITSVEFGTLMGTLALLASGTVTPEQLPDILAGIAPVLAKLKQYDGTPSLQTCFDAKGFPSEVLAQIPELAGYEPALFLSAHIRVNKRQQPLEPT